MINFLSPLGFLFGLLALPILLLYMLKLKREDKQVSSTFLWQMALQDRQANTPWQRLRRNLLLLLQLLVLAALVLALSRPALPTDTISNAQLIVVLDASASMQSTDMPPSRFAIATQELSKLINGLQPNSEMTIILAQNQPSTVIAHSTNKKDLRDALDNIEAGYSTPNWQATFTLVNASISTPDHSIILISDGGLPETDFTLFSENIEYLRIGQESENVGISAFSATAIKDQVALFVKLTNYGIEDKPLILSIYQDGLLYDAERVILSAGTTDSRVFDGLPNTKANYEARLSSDIGEAQLDYLPVDDVAYIAYTPPQAGEILLITSGNFFLEQFLSALPDSNAFRILPDQIEDLPREDFSVYIFDGIMPDKLPDGNLLLINPPPNNLFLVHGTTRDYGRIEVQQSSLTRFVEWQNIQILEIAQIELPIWGEPLINSDAGPVVFIGEVDGRRIATVSFDIHQSDLPLHIAFPILFNNLLSYLNPPTIFDASNGIKIGETLNINPGPEAESVTINGPDGAAYTLAAGESGALFTNTTQPGIYSVATNLDEQLEYFAVNLFEPIESKISSPPTLNLSQQEQDTPSQAQAGILELWPWLGALGIMVLVLEWHIYQQRRLPIKLWQNLRQRFKQGGSQ